MEAPSSDGATLVSKNHCRSNKVLQKQHCGVVSTEQWVVGAKRSKLVSVRPSCVSRVNLLGSAVSSGEPVYQSTVVPKCQQIGVSVCKSSSVLKVLVVSTGDTTSTGKLKHPHATLVATIGTKVLIVLIC